MAKKPSILLKCPVRGDVVSSQEEEIYVIECVKYLVYERGIDPKKIRIQETLKKFGAGGRNSLEPDIMVLRKPLAANSKIDPNDVVIVAEVKVKASDRESALDNQLFPAMDFCKNIDYGIYWDKTSRECYNSNKTKINIASMYDANKILKVSDLLPIQHGDEIWSRLEKLMHTQKGSGKISQATAANLIKVIVTKYFDEIANDPIEMYKQPDESAGDIKVRVNKIYDEACQYYKFTEGLKNYLSGGINLSASELSGCLDIIQDYSLSSTEASIIQNFYMKFAPKFLKKDLDQYYTPKELVEFMVQDTKLTRKTLALDPCSGTGDMMVGIFHRMKKITAEAHNNIHCWDIDDEVVPLAQLNMILMGDGRTNIKCQDSLEEYDFENGAYDLIVTNPPFGNDNEFKGDSVNKYENSEKKVGKLFIERDLNLLKKGGLLVTVIPTGYMNNPEDIELREIISEKARILAMVKLPGGVFSVSGTAVETSILYLQKWNDDDDKQADYNIFVDWVTNVGFKAGSKKYKPEYKRALETGIYETDENNNKIQQNELIGVSAKLKSFAKDENIACLEHTDNQVKYDVVNFNAIKSKNFILSPMQYTTEKDGYQKTIKHLGKNCFNLEKINADITQSKHSIREDSKIYNYLRTGNIKLDQILEIEKLRGWELPDRAKLEDVKAHDIILAAMQKSDKSFGYIYQSYPSLIISNGFFRIRIADEKYRLSFYKFLLSNDYKNQIRALPSGTIMPTVKENDLKKLLMIPLLSDDEIKETKNMLSNREKYLSLYDMF